MGQVIFTLETFLPVKPKLVVSIQTAIYSSKSYPQKLMMGQKLNIHPWEF